MTIIKIKFCHFLLIFVGLMSINISSLSATESIIEISSEEERTITGSVVDNDDIPLIGVNVIVVGTTIGTITDFDGNFSIDVPDDAKELEFSYTGFSTVRVTLDENSSIEVMMQAGTQLDEVVVTALGISREKKSLSYSISEVGADDIATVKDHNALNSLVGKVAGINVTQGTGGPGSGSRIVIRGNNSITSNNQPLIVVDGLPIDDSGSNSGGSVYNSTVTGGGITDINPDDIASISILKGPNAAALYGSRASNGVLLITTKSGVSRDGIGVSVTSNTTFENPMFLPEYQNQYGQGTNLNVPGNVTDLKNASGSWGPQLDGSSKLYYTGDSRSYSAQPNNVTDFFRTGHQLINTLALEGGSEGFTARFSYTNNSTNGVLPNSDLNSHNFNLRSQIQLSDRLSLDAKGTYFTQRLNNRVSQGSEGIMSYLLTMPRNVAIADLETYQNINEGLDAVSYGALGANPYWILNHDTNFNNRERFLSFAKLTYELTDWMSAFVRVGTDVANTSAESVNQAGHHFYKSGRLFASSGRNQETNADFLLMIDRDLTSQVNLNLNIGGNTSYRTGEGIGLRAENFKIPTRPILANTVEQFSNYSPLVEKKINSLYASASFSYDGFLYVDVSGRNDWSSTLAEENRSFFYPSVGVSLLLTRFLDAENSFFDLIKVKGNYAEVGNDTEAYQLNTLYFVAQDGYLGRTTLSRDNIRKSESLRPEAIKSSEIGMELKALNNRLFADMSYYTIASTDLIFDVPVPSATGFGFFRENVGKVTNSGIELLIGGSPILRRDFQWNISANYAKNTNKLDELIDDLDSYVLNTTNSGNVAIQATVNGGYGDIYGTTWRTNDAGQVIVNSSGIPLASTERSLLGNAQPDWIGGISNSFGYKNVSLSFLIDARVGGQIYSSTNADLDGAGVSVQSLEFRESGITVDGVVEQADGSFVTNSTQITAQQYWGAYSGIGANYVYDQTNVRLREFALGFKIPKSILGSTGIQGATLSLIGRNLFFLKKDVPHIDPEAALGTGNSGMGILSYNLPTLRSIGLNLSVKL